MAVQLIANYSKRLGLPGYSSHQFSVSVEIELVTTDDVAAESRRLYNLLQTSVDEQIQTTGFVPSTTCGMEGDAPSSAVSHRGSSQTPFNDGSWACSDKQRELLLKLVEEHHLDKNEVEVLARQRFGAGVLRLNKAKMSGLLDFLLEQHGGGSSRRPPAGQSRSQRDSSTSATRRAA